VVTANGSVGAFGDAKFYGDLPDLGKHVSDVVAIAPPPTARATTRGRGRGLLHICDAKFHGSLPGIHLRVKDVVGVVATPSGQGYLLVGSDGGVFTFGAPAFTGRYRALASTYTTSGPSCHLPRDWVTYSWCRRWRVQFPAPGPSSTARCRESTSAFLT